MVIQRWTHITTTKSVQSPSMKRFAYSIKSNFWMAKISHSKRKSIVSSLPSRWLSVAYQMVAFMVCTFLVCRYSPRKCFKVCTSTPFFQPNSSVKMRINLKLWCICCCCCLRFTEISMNTMCPTAIASLMFSSTTESFIFVAKMERSTSNFFFFIYVNLLHL